MTLLFLNSIGTGEFILILFVILMLFGSKGLPDFAKNIAKGMREIKGASDEIRRDIQNSALEMRRDLNVPTIEELTKTDELKKIEDMISIDEKTTKSEPVPETKAESTDSQSTNSKAENSTTENNQS